MPRNSDISFSFQCSGTPEMFSFQYSDTPILSLSNNLVQWYSDTVVLRQSNTIHYFVAITLQFSFHIYISIRTTQHWPLRDNSAMRRFSTPTIPHSDSATLRHIVIPIERYFGTLPGRDNILSRRSSPPLQNGDLFLLLLHFFLPSLFLLLISLLLLLQSRCDNEK